MVVNLVRQSGVPALAYPSSDVSSLWPCSLFLLYHEPASLPVLQFTALLKASVPFHGMDGAHPIVLVLDGDNLVPGSSSLDAPNVAIPHSRINTISREGRPAPRMLSLALRGPPSLRYPRSWGHVARLDTPCRELVHLARATEVHIVFDSQWLSRTSAQLNRAVRSTLKLSTVPVVPDSAYDLLYRPAPSSILHFVDHADAARPSIEHALDQAPPPYHASGKRQRQSRTPTPDQQLPKRPAQRATPATPATEKSDTVEVDTLHELVTIAVKKNLPDALRDAAAADTLQDLVASAVRKELPSVLEDMLPRMLRRAQVLGVRPPLHPPPPPPPVVIIASPLNAYMRTHIDDLITAAGEQATNDIANEASDHHQRIRTELSEELAEHKVDVEMIKNDHLAHFSRECDDICLAKGEEMKKDLDGYEEELQEHLDGYEEEMGKRIEKKKTDVEVEIDLRHEFACRRFAQKQALQEQGRGRKRRAASMPS